MVRAVEGARRGGVRWGRGNVKARRGNDDGRRRTIGRLGRRDRDTVGGEGAREGGEEGRVVSEEVHVWWVGEEAGVDERTSSTKSPWQSEHCGRGTRSGVISRAHE